MATLRAAAVAALVMAVLYVALDAGHAAAAPGTSVALLALGLLFGAGAWAFGAAGRGERSPDMAGLAAALALYALLRLALA